MAVEVDRRATKRLGHGEPEPYDAGYPPAGAASIDDLIEARVAGYVGAIVRPLMDEIEGLRNEIARLRPERYPASMFRAEAATYLGLAPPTFDRLVSDGHIPYRHVDGLEWRVYLRDDLDAYLAAGTR